MSREKNNCEKLFIPTKNIAIVKRFTTNNDQVHFGFRDYHKTCVKQSTIRTYMFVHRGKKCRFVSLT